MNPLHDKIAFGATLLVSSAFSALGAVLTAGETRWLFVTFTVSFLMSGFLALIFKTIDDNIRVVIGRCGFAIFGGIFASQPAVHYLGIQTAQTDIIALGGVAGVVCGGFFLVGFALLKIVENRAPQLAEKIFKRYNP